MDSCSSDIIGKLSSEGDLIDEYGGSEIHHIGVISCSIDPRDFFSSFVTPRIPVKLVMPSSSTQGTDCATSAGKVNLDYLIQDLRHRWTNSYLKEVAGDELVKVEVRSKSADVEGAVQFGLGKEVQMTFGSFVSSVDGCAEEHYLTTQDLSYDEEERPHIVSPPLNRQLMHDLAYRPLLLGHLVVQNINMWFGCSSLPSSSGLHHDYHDNLYLLLRGEKHFTLYSPKEYRHMYLHGRVVKVHPNGRINYEHQPTLADGSHAASWRALHATDRVLAAASRLEQIAATDDSADCLEDEIEEALEAALDAEICYDQWDSEIESSDEADSELDSGSDEAAIGDDPDFNEGGLPPGLGKRSSDSSSFPPPAVSEPSKKKLCKDGMAAAAARTTVTDSAAAAAPLRPPNFSRVDTALPLRELVSEFPLFAEAQSRSLSVTVRAGEVLYVPAGWFHEVRSSGSGPDGHLALNYWCHPPDTARFEAPYSSQFWERDWSSRNLPSD